MGYWLLYEALLSLSEPNDRALLLRMLLSRLGRTISTPPLPAKHAAAAAVTGDASSLALDSSQTNLSKEVLARCLEQHIEIFELEDLVSSGLLELRSRTARKG